MGEEEKESLLTHVIVCSFIFNVAQFNEKNDDQMFLCDMQLSVFSKKTVAYDVEEHRYMRGDDDVRPFPKSMSYYDCLSTQKLGGTDRDVITDTSIPFLPNL